MIQTINPTIKAVAVLIPGILLSFAFDIVTPLLFLVYLLVLTFFFAAIPWKKWLLFFLPLSIFAMGVAWMTMLYTDESYQTGPVLFQFLWFEVTLGSLQVGVSLALRSLCFITLSLLFALTTDPTKFMLSLMQQVKLSPKITYGILAGYRFLPTFQTELVLIKQAHQIRGVQRAKGFKQKWQHYKQYAIPLLANSIRKAERVAVAMESKGFTGDRHRTFYHALTISLKDWLFLAGMLAALALAYYLSYQLGYLRLIGQ
ncbi:energy-coupling factor transporter transmembrane component T family protein [Gracilibacillus alcaliphilus]|uniref:energy-coupling factor transporter transmembrane component T family protein n=1 Tax=Gracilibacillus alcaliphilus TaxID=1401441 RepID=UPI001958A72C|nr:energy-coupling factor transporter transmembrane component T [Gracilibacillus alcaliphilus]MBM7675372.1 energy-coupling factor transport system permease protein [Gracilibacillus alcaliphilus]